MSNNKKHWLFGICFSPMAPHNRNSQMYCVDMLDMCTNNIDEISMPILDYEFSHEEAQLYLNDYLQLMHSQYGDNWRSRLFKNQGKSFYKIADFEYRPDLYLIFIPKNNEMHFFRQINSVIDFLSLYNMADFLK